MQARSRISTALAAASALVIALVGAGCGADEPANLENGKTLFKQKCAQCHDLARANSEGATAGPDLDAAFAAARDDGQGESTFEGIVDEQIQNPYGPQMPANLVEGDDRRDVAAYVAYAAAKAGEDMGALARAGQPPEREDAVVAEGGVLNLPADPSGLTAFVGGDNPEGGVVTKAEAEPGQLELVMENLGTIEHNIAIRGEGLQPALGPVVPGGGTSRVQANVKKGTYTFFCSVGSHEQQGMAGELTVE